MVESLATERHVQFSPKRVRRDFEDLVAFPCVGSVRDPVVRHRLAELAVEVAEVRALSLVLLDAIGRRSAVVEAAGNKLAGSEACQHIARLPSELGAPEALVRGTDSSSSGASRSPRRSAAARRR